MKRNLAHFSVPLAANTDNSELIRKCLVFYEGDHTDNNNRTHSYPKNRVLTLVDNTNEFLDSGDSIPVLFDHKKTTSNTVGAITGSLEARNITEEDIEELGNPKLRNLVGKLGVFCDSVSLRAKKAITSFTENLVKTVSPGIDFQSDVLRELSIVPIPAITGLALYSHFNEEEDNKSSNAITFEDALKEEESLDEIREEYEHLTDTLWKVICNIHCASRETLGESDPALYIYQALDDFGMQVANLLELPDPMQLEEEANNYDSSSALPRGSEMSEYLTKQQELNRSQYTGIRNILASFSNPSIGNILKQAAYK